MSIVHYDANKAVSEIPNYTIDQSQRHDGSKGKVCQKVYQVEFIICPMYMYMCVCVCSLKNVFYLEIGP